MNPTDITHNYDVTAIIGDRHEDFVVEATSEANAIALLKPELAGELAQAERDGLRVDFIVERQPTFDELADQELELVRRQRQS